MTNHLSTVSADWVDILSSADESVADPTIQMIRSETFIVGGHLTFARPTYAWQESR